MLLASGDAASGYINPSLPQLLPVAAAASLAVGATLNTVVLPQLGQVSLNCCNVVHGLKYGFDISVCLVQLGHTPISI